MIDAILWTIRTVGVIASVAFLCAIGAYAIKSILQLWEEFEDDRGQR